MKKCLSLLALVCAISAKAENFEKGPSGITIDSPTEFIALVITDQKIFNIDQVKPDYPLVKEVLLSRPSADRYRTLLLLEQSSDMAPLGVQSYVGPSDLVWLKKNKVLQGSGLEWENNLSAWDPLSRDPKEEQQENLKIIKSHDAWNVSQGHEVIVAVTDTGVDLDHEDLKENIWINPNEIAGNGKDDDGNGFIDDISGWNFCNNNFRITDEESHGTHVAGIIAATKGNNLGVAGIAPGVKIMPLKWWGTGCHWNIASVVKTYAYAVDNGADIINTSFDIDLMVDEPAYAEIVDYAYEKNVLIFNSSGNTGRLDPARGKAEQVILVASTQVLKGFEDKKSSFSTYGEDIDISAPGSDILSSVPGGKYERKSGTSMASPSAAAVAALIWSRHPEWTKEQVVCKLMNSSDHIDHKNKSFGARLGAGRINAKGALSDESKAPWFSGVRYERVGGWGSKMSHIILVAKRLFDANAILDINNYQLYDLDRNQEVPLKLLTTSYSVGTNRIIFDPQQKLPRGRYVFKAFSTHLTNPFGVELDGDKDGIAGGDFEFEFKVGWW